MLDFAASDTRAMEAHVASAVSTAIARMEASGPFPSTRTRVCFARIVQDTFLSMLRVAFDAFTCGSHPIRNAFLKRFQAHYFAWVARILFPAEMPVPDKATVLFASALG